MIHGPAGINSGPRVPLRDHKSWHCLEIAVRSRADHESSVREVKLWRSKREKGASNPLFGASTGLVPCRPGALGERPTQGWADADLIKTEHQPISAKTLKFSPKSATLICSGKLGAVESGFLKLGKKTWI